MAVPPALRVLVVDDHADAAVMVRDAFRALGHRCESADGGRAALAYAASLDLDLIVLDIGMPDLSGYEVVRRLRATPRGRDIVIVALTAWGSDADLARARDAGFDHHVLKPASLAKIRELVELVQLRQPAAPPAEIAASEASVALRALVARLDRSREDDRALLAREIHDELSQELAVVRLDLSRLVRELGPHATAEPVRARLAAIDSRIDGMFGTASRMISELHPRVLDDLGLVAAIEAHARDLVRATGLAIELSLPDELALERTVGTAVFRSYRELVTNVLQHARARTIEVSLHAICAHADAVELRVTDDGIGMPSSTPSRDALALGLHGIRERARELGGVFAIGPRTTRGTVATVSIPRGARSDAD